MTIADIMRREWNARAKENTYHWVVSTCQSWDSDAFYEDGRKDVARLVLPILAKKYVHADAIRRLSVLEIGCGTGRVCRALKEHCGEVTGVDIAPEMVERAERENAGIAGLRFLLTSGDDLSPRELHHLLVALGFRSVETYHETEKYLWAEMTK